jgi:tetratricopeptide (TPR) repeat protein
LVLTLTLAVTIEGATARSAAAATEKESELNARQAFAAARYDEAIEIFARLYAETLNPIYLRNIGRCHQKKREPDKAIDAFEDYLAKGKSITATERKEIQGYIKDMERLRDDQAQQAKEKDKERDKDKAFSSAPPPPAVATAPAARPSGASPAPPRAGATTVNIATGPAPWPGYGTAPPPDPARGDPTLVARPEPPAGQEQHHPIYTRWWFWAGIGVVVAGGVAAALLIPGGTTRPPCFSSIPGDCK